MIVNAQHLSPVHLIEPGRLVLELQRCAQALPVGDNRNGIIADMLRKVESGEGPEAVAARSSGEAGRDTRMPRPSGPYQYGRRRIPTHATAPRSDLSDDDARRAVVHRRHDEAGHCAGGVAAAAA